jgi:hypothetical protein
VDEYIKRFPSLQDIAYDNRIATCDASKDVLKKHLVCSRNIWLMATLALRGST